MKENLQTIARQFQEEGILTPITLFSEETIKKHQLAFKNLENHLEKPLECYENLHLYFSWANEIATHPDLLNRAAAILGPEVLVTGTMILSKLPRYFSHLSWHQDAYYSQEDDSVPYLTAWIALSDVTVANGCMRVIPGSHKGGIIPHLPFETDDKNLIKQGEEIKISPGEDEILDIVLKPGEMSFHHGCLIHCSNPNQTDQKRIGFIVRFSTPKIQSVFNPVIQVYGNTSISHLPVFDKAPALTIEEGIPAFLGKTFEKMV